jgi:hypothetical protein
MLLPRKPLKPRTFRIAPGQVRHRPGCYIVLQKCTQGEVCVREALRTSARPLRTTGARHRLPDHQHPCETVYEVTNVQDPAQLGFTLRTKFCAAQSVLVGGVARLDVVAAPAATIYITLWASADLVTHFGKTDVAADKCDAELLLCVPIVCTPADMNN